MHGMRTYALVTTWKKYYQICNEIWIPVLYSIYIPFKKYLKSELLGLTCSVSWHVLHRQCFGQQRDYVHQALILPPLCFRKLFGLFIYMFIICFLQGKNHFLKGYTAQKVRRILTLMYKILVAGAFYKAIFPLVYIKTHCASKPISITLKILCWFSFILYNITRTINPQK